MKHFFIALTMLIAGASSKATVDSIGRVTIPYVPVHAERDFNYLAENWNDSYSNTKMFCVTDSLYWDEYSSSSLPAYERMMMPFEIPVVPGNSSDFKTAQINALYDGKVKVTTDWDAFDKYVKEGANNEVWIHEPTFVVDVSAYDQSTRGGRLQAITMAKLATMTLHYNLAKNGWTLFRLTIEVKGLPSDQNEFKKSGWTPAYAKTNYPYSSSSPVAQNYYKELIATEFCPQTLDTAKSFAE